MAIDPIAAYNQYIYQTKPFNFNSAQPVDKQIKEVDPKTSGAIPFGQLTGKSATPIAPPEAKQNFMNGLAPSNNLQNVYAGEYKGKENILNQLGIA